MTTQEHHERNYKHLAIVLVALSFLVTLSYGLVVSNKDHHLEVAMACLLIAGAPFALGGFFGFLFGLPKTASAAQAAGSDTKAKRKHGWETNTNLEQVSDWLTKILIGVGLTELKKMPAMVQHTGEYLAQALGASASASVVCAMLVVFSIAGFVTAYLLTKFDLARAIDEADGLLEQLANQIVKNPNDRAAVESFMLSALYLESPASFEKPIQAGEAFLNQDGHPQPEDGDVFAYLACAYGQKHAWLVAHSGSADEIKAARDSTIESTRQALARVPSWRARLRQFANPPVGSNDDDLVTLKDDPELKALLEVA